MRTEKLSWQWRDGDCGVGKGVRECETFIGRMAYRRK
jgi:hypothetical protein